MPQFEFLISRKSRDNYQFDEQIFSLSGNGILTDFSNVRHLANNIARGQNKNTNDIESSASGINAKGIIEGIMHFLFYYYEKQNTTIMERIFKFLEVYLKQKLDDTLFKFVDEFPPLVVYRGDISQQDYLTRETDGIHNRQIALEKMLLLHFADINPAFQNYSELFDLKTLKEKSSYIDVIELLIDFLKHQPGLDEAGRLTRSDTMLNLFLAPIEISPHSLAGQLDYLLNKWSNILGNDFIQYIQQGIEILRLNLKKIDSAS